MPIYDKNKLSIGAKLLINWADKQTKRQIDNQNIRQTNRLTNGQSEYQTNKQIDEWTIKISDKQTDRLINRQSEYPTNEQIDKYISRISNRQIYQQNIQQTNR